VTQNIDTDENNPMSRFLLHIFAAFGELERETIRERVFCGLRTAKAKGKPLGGPSGFFAVMKRYNFGRKEKAGVTLPKRSTFLFQHWWTGVRKNLLKRSRFHTQNKRRKHSWGSVRKSEVFRTV